MSTVAPRWVRTTGAASVALVALVAAIVSYSHMYVLASRAGEGWRAWLEPLSVDGLLVGSSLVLYVRQRSSWLTWASVFLGILVSLAANLAAAAPELVSRLVAAWPAVALALSYEVLLSIVRQGSDTPGDQPKHTDEDGKGVHAVDTPGGDLAATGADRKTIRRDIEVGEMGPPDPEAAPVTGIDGKTYDHQPSGDDLVARARRLVAAGEANGVTVGRARLARELEIGEHQARQLLATLRNGVGHE